MNIIFYETHHHFEVIGAYISHLIMDNRFQFSVCSNQKVKQQIQQFYPNSNKISYFSLERNLNQFNPNHSVLILTSPVDLYKLNLKEGFRVFYVIHNIHYTFSPNQHRAPFTIKRWLKFLFVQRKLLRNRSFLNMVEAFIFLSPKLESYFKSQHKEFSELKTLVWPSILCYDFKESSTEIKGEYVVVPGATDDNRRDYNILFEALKQMRDISLKIVFLGKASRKIQQNMKDFRESKIEIISYDRALDYSTYYKILSNSKAVIIPLKKKKIYNSVVEEFGNSTFSATLLDTLAVQKIGIIPSYIELEDQIKENFLPYNDASQLAEILSNNLNSSSELNINTYLQNYIDLMKMELLSLTFDATGN